MTLRVIDGIDPRPQADALEIEALAKRRLAGGPDLLPRPRLTVLARQACPRLGAVNDCRFGRKRVRLVETREGTGIWTEPMRGGSS
jgi:hypothetical protein